MLEIIDYLEYCFFYYLKRFAIAFGLFFSAPYVLRDVHDYIRDKAFEKITKGLSSTEEFSRRLTGKKFNGFR